MSAQLQRIADAITRNAGWKAASPDEEGILRFSLDGGLDFCLLSPEGRTAILLADLGPAPVQGMGDDELSRLASVAAAALKKRRSVFAVAEGRLELHRAFAMNGLSDAEACTHTRDVLNDSAWWKRQVERSGASGGSAPSSGSSPFSFNLGGWFSGGGF